MPYKTTGTHVGYPLKGTQRMGGIDREFASVLGVPIEAMNAATYNTWRLDIGAASLVGALGTATSFDCGTFSVGEGGSTNTTAKIDYTDAGAFLTKLPATDDLEVSILGPGIFKPAAGRPIYFFYQGEISSITNVSTFIGLSVGKDAEAVGPITASTGATTTTDQIGVFSVDGTSSTLYVKDGATADSIAFDAAITAGDEFGLMMEIGLNEVKYVWMTLDGGLQKGSLALTNNAPISDLARMAPWIAMTNKSTTAHNFTHYRAWCAQEKGYGSLAGFVSGFGQG